eukprot:10396206-Alexandrium_andersonii.AAC.1
MRNDSRGLPLPVSVCDPVVSVGREGNSWERRPHQLLCNGFRDAIPVFAFVENFAQRNCDQPVECCHPAAARRAVHCCPVFLSRRVVAVCGAAGVGAVRVSASPLGCRCPRGRW